MVCFFLGLAVSRKKFGTGYRLGLELVFFGSLVGKSDFLGGSAVAFLVYLFARYRLELDFFGSLVGRIYSAFFRHLATWFSRFTRDKFLPPFFLFLFFANWR